MSDEEPGSPATDPLATYRYGDSDVAADRLALLAEVFEPSTAAFLDAAVAGPVELALDLGSGPGHTTRLVAGHTPATRTVGLEASPAFVARASASAPIGSSRIEFVLHDARVVPFPTGPGDVVFARYLLAHLDEVDLVVEAWITQLRPHGRLLLEEIVAIDTDHPVFERYVAHVTDLSRAHGTDLLVGRHLGGEARRAGAAIVHDAVVPITPDPGTVARLFAMNLAVWRSDPWARAETEPAELDELAARLAELADDPPPPGAIAWRHRQLAYERG